MIKVLNITGWGRSGSTILASLLGQVPGYLSVGELRHLWDRGLLKGMACACSRPLRECDLWSRAAKDFIDRPREEIERILRLREGFSTLDCARQALRRDPAVDNTLLEYAAHLSKILKDLQAATGCRVIVDSSKRPQHGYVLELIPEVDLRVLHLVRDPRGVAYSWRRKRVYSEDGGGPRYMKRYRPYTSSIHWVVRNLLTEILWNRNDGKSRYLRVGYEEFTESPREVITRILRFVEESSPLDFFLDERTVEMGATHEISGNPSRFHAGRVEIRDDARWRQEMRRMDRAEATIAALPLLRRYGYGVTGGDWSR